jgi:L-ascorbate metabolism protein UlaG (beta-lactamase superfamily)
MAVNIKWLGHASFKITGAGKIVYIDPWKLTESAKDATIVCVSHGHYDHYSAQDIKKISGPDTVVIGPADVVGNEQNGRLLKPGGIIEVSGIKVAGVASYNPAKQFHPKSNNWLGFVIEIASTRIYYAGDTDLIGEMKELKDIDVALLPVGGTYTMDAKAASDAALRIKPGCAIPYHFGDIVGSKTDAEKFSQNAGCQVEILKPGQTFDL